MGTEAKIFVGHAVTKAPEAFTHEVDAFKDRLRDQQDYEVLDPLGLGHEPNDIYRYAIKRCVAECTLFVAVCDYAPFGVGYELATAVEKHGKLALAVARQDQRVTNLLPGIEDEDNPNYTFARYQDLIEDVPPMVAEILTHRSATTSEAE